jgi:hypothetical protein
MATQRRRFGPTRPPVRSAPLESRAQEGEEDTRHRKESAIVSRTRLRKQRGNIERATAWIVLVLSVLGTIATFAGGWTPLVAGIIARTPQWYAIVGGIALQVVLTFLEWYYFDQPFIAWPARGFDTLMTALGYGPLVLVGLVTFLVARGVPFAQVGYVAWGIIGLVSLAIAWYPESRLVD